MPGVSPLLQALYERRLEDAEGLRATAGPLTIFEAAAVGERDRVAELLDADPALLDAVAADGFTPLHLAAFFGHGEIVALLLSRGAHPGPVARNPMLVQPLHSAVAARDAASVRALIAAGADVDARQQRGVTPLHAAAHHGDAELVALLLDAGADPALADDDGASAADHARGGGFDDLARRLETT